MARGSDVVAIFGTNVLSNHAFTFYHTPLSKFELLPAEIRLLIYAHLGYPTKPARCMPVSPYKADNVSVRTNYRFESSDGKHDQRRVQDPLRPRRRCRPFRTDLMRVNRRIRADLYALLYQQCWITFDFEPGDMHWQ